ncbi:MAG TPA: hypothetical protein VK994_03845 [Bacteroidales bacterium]|nr:hypothetical protein [Bacteroidales bacterium]
MIAIISYLAFVGWIIAFVLYQNDKSEYAIYHMRQSLGLNIIWVIGWVVFWIPVVGWIAAILFFVFWLMGLIYAAQGEMKPVPLFGEFFQNLFREIK